MARRLNTRFLTILLLVLGGIVAAALLAERFLIHERPDRYIAAGEDAMKQHKWNDALVNFSRAARLAPRDARVMVMLGKTYDQLAQSDPQAFQAEVAAYEKALEIDPNYLPALLDLSALYVSQASQDPNATLYSKAIDYTQRAHAADPNNEKLQSLGDKLVVEQWASGLSTDQDAVDKAVKEMRDLWQKNPADADLPFSIATAEIEEGTLIANQNPGQEQLPEVTDHYKKAVGTFDPAFTGPGGGPQASNPPMHFALARVLARLSAIDQSSPDVQKSDQDGAAAEISLARKFAKAEDPDYLEINEFAAEMAMQKGDRASAIAIYKAMPPTPRTEIALADVLARSPETQAEAVALLQNTLASLTDDPNHIAFYGNRFLTMMELTRVRVFQYLEMPQSPEKKKAHDDIRSSLDILDQVTGFRTYPPLKEIEARFEMGSGAEEEMAMIQSLSKMMADNPPSTKEYYWYALQMLLAQGYVDTNQTSNALAILQQVVQQRPRDIPARDQLVKLLLIEQPDQVRPQLEQLATLDPTNPNLNLYRIQLLMSDPDKNKDAISKFYTELKENTPQMMSVKARMAMRIQNYDDAIRLFKASLVKDPGQVEDWVMLSRLQFMLDKKDDALDTATRGLAANPKDPALRLLIPKIKGENGKVIQDLQIELAKENPNKTEGELTMAAMAHMRGDYDEEGKHLEAALKLSPDSTRILELLFQHYLQMKELDKAAQCIPPLAKADADRAGGELYRLTLARAQGDNTTAEAIARKLTQDRPEFARSWLAMGDVLRAEGNYEEAIPQYNNCLQKESSLVEGYVGLAECYYGLKRYDDALHTIEDGLSRLPDDQTLSQMKLSHEISYGRPEEAIKEISDEITLHPEEPRLYAGLADANLRYCDELRKNHQDDDAVKQAQEVVNNLGDPLSRFPDEPELYEAMAQSQLAANDPQGAVKTLIAWSQRPAWQKAPEPYVALSIIYERLGQNDQAEDEMHTAMQRSGYRVDLQLRMANLLAIHKKADAALTLLRSVNADNPDVQGTIIQVLLVTGRFDDAQTEIRADLAKNPPNAEKLMTTWAMAGFEHQRYSEAIDHATQALAMDPKDVTAMFCRGRAYLEMRPADPNSAVKDLEQVRQSSPNNIEVKLALADTYLMLNRQEDATTELEAGLRVLPDNKRLRMKLVDLYVNGAHPRLPEALKLLTDVDGLNPFNKDWEIFENESVILAKMGDKPNALVKAEMARQLAPDNAEIVRTEIQLMLDTQNYQGVMDIYAALADSIKSTDWALLDLAMAEKGLGNPQALADYNRALTVAVKEDSPVNVDNIGGAIAQQFGYPTAISSLAPLARTYVPAKISLARVFQAQGDNASAIATVESIMGNFDSVSVRDKVNVLSSAALMYQLAKPKPLVDKAYDAYLDWLKLEPDNLEALNNIACLLADDYTPPRAAEGLQYANRAVNRMSDLGRTEPRMLDTQGWLQILNGTPDDGILTLSKAMNDFEPFPEEYLHLGEGYLRKDLPDPQQAEMQAKLGLQMVVQRNGGTEDGELRAKLQDLINRSEEVMHSKQQAQAP
jgi:tetratricopeptide (TPR) repeat protein